MKYPLGFFELFTVDPSGSPGGFGGRSCLGSGPVLLVPKLGHGRKESSSITFGALIHINYYHIYIYTYVDISICIHMYVLKVHLKSPQKQKSRMYWFQFWLLQRKRHRANMFLAIDPDINYLFHRVSIIFSGYVHFFGEKFGWFSMYPLSSCVVFIVSLYLSFISYCGWLRNPAPPPWMVETL